MNVEKIGLIENLYGLRILIHATIFQRALLSYNTSPISNYTKSHHMLSSYLPFRAPPIDPQKLTFSTPCTSCSTFPNHMPSISFFSSTVFVAIFACPLSPALTPVTVSPSDSSCSLHRISRLFLDSTTFVAPKGTSLPFFPTPSPDEDKLNDAAAIAESPGLEALGTVPFVNFVGKPFGLATRIFSFSLFSFTLDIDVILVELEMGWASR